MSKPVCPDCNGLNVVPYPFSAGHNRCLTCGHIGVVRDFHPAPADHCLVMPHKGDKTLADRAKAVLGRSAPMSPTEPEQPPEPRRYWWQEE